jgi:hypothetical protein
MHFQSIALDLGIWVNCSDLQSAQTQGGGVFFRAHFPPNPALVHTLPTEPMASAHEAQSLPPILRLPAELLSEILSLVVPNINPPDLEPRRWSDRPSHITDSPFHCVRSSCRTFRWIVDELPFWNKDDCDIDDLWEWRPKDKGPSHHTLQSGEPEPSYCPYIGVVVSDPHLQQCLDRKKSWLVAHPPLFEQLRLSMPRFGLYVQLLQLNGNGACNYGWGHVTANLFEIFPILTELDVESNDHVCMKRLPKTLRSLRIEAPLIEHCDCQMEFPNLELLLYVPLDYVPLDFKRMLPFKSTETFRELVFEFTTPWPPSIDNQKDFRHIHQFKNLTSLTLRPLSSEICRLLLQSPLRLKTFQSTTVSDKPIRTGVLVDLLNSPVCANLESLQLQFKVTRFPIVGVEVLDAEKRVAYEPLVRTIALLPNLEELDLLYPLHPTWIKHFQSASRLRRIDWNQDIFLFEDECDDNELEEDLLKILEEFGDGREVNITDSLFFSDEESGEDGSEGEETDDELDGETAEELDEGNLETGEESEGGETNHDE